ncbi:MAG: serine/threonine-protein kinase [Tannerellaceae bacterium]|jgi:serine/threonine protein kinase|nr:serine/threonine-protein kinase [Tannerellaceae bacterium]
MQITISPEYRRLATFVERLPIRFETEGESVYKARNEIKLMHAGGLDVAVKSFRIPHIINRIAYTFFRPSKARRSYFNALKLQEAGVNTPSPVAYMEEKKGGLLSRSFYISSYVGYPGLLRELNDRSLDQVKDLAEAFAHFTADVHNRGILHRDYSPGNVLYEKKEGQYHFCLVDINRMSFCKRIDERAAALSLRRLWGNTDVIVFIAEVYARDRGFDEKVFKDKVLLYLRRFRKGM